LQLNQDVVSVSSGHKNAVQSRYSREVANVCLICCD